jgi:hypothetical protein
LSYARTDVARTDETRRSVRSKSEHCNHGDALAVRRRTNASTPTSRSTPSTHSQRCTRNECTAALDGSRCHNFRLWSEWGFQRELRDALSPRHERCRICLPVPQVTSQSDQPDQPDQSDTEGTSRPQGDSHRSRCCLAPRHS